MTHFVIIRLDNQTYAIPLAQVERVLWMAACAPVPGAGPEILGMLNLAGSLLPVVDLRQRFGFPARPPSIHDRLLILNIPPHTAALLVDEVTRVLEVEPGRLEAPPPGLVHSPLVAAMFREGDEIVMVLEASRLLAFDLPANSAT
jgi:chemotaxis signal transduction protein